MEAIFDKYVIVLMPHSSASNHSQLVYTYMPIKYIKTVKLSMKAISNTEEEDGGWKNGTAKTGEHDRLIGLGVYYRGN